MSPTCRPRASLVPSLVLLVSIVWSASSSADTGAPPGQWVSLGPTKILAGWSGVSNGDVTGRVTTIAVDFSDPSLIFVGARGSGVWRSPDGGHKWEPVTDSLPTQTVVALATAPSLSRRVYLNTPIGTFRSEDAGSTWNQVSTADLLGRGWDGGAMLVDPVDPDRVFLTSCGSGVGGASIQRSIDGGVSWQTMLSQGCSTGLVRDPGDPNRLMAAISNGDPATTGIWETLDGGDTWTRKPGCPAAPLPDPAPNTSVRIAQSGDVRLVSYRWGGDQYRVYRAEGKTCGKDASVDYVWQQAWVAPPALVGGDLWSALNVDPADPSRVAATGANLFVSTDGGFTFTIPDPRPHLDHHAWIYSPRDPAVVFAGTDGGFYRSTEDGLAGTWTFLGEGIVNAELYDLADSPTSPRLLMGGSQDNGAFEYPGSGKVWRWRWEGDAEMVEIDPTDDRVRYSASQAESSLAVTTDAYATNPVAIGMGLPAGCPPWSGDYPANPSNQFLIHPGRSSTLLATCTSLWTRLPPWFQLFTPNPNTHPPGRTMTIAVDASVDLYWTATNNGQVWAGPGGVDWRWIVSHPGGAPSVALEVDTANPTVLFAAFRPPQGCAPGNSPACGRVFRVERFASAPTSASVLAIDITANLPAGIVMKSLAVDRLQPQTIFAGTDFGVYRGHSADGGATWSWTPYKNGIAEAVDVRALEIHPTTGVMRAGTFGRGVYEVDTDWPMGALIAVDGRLTLLRVQDVGQLYGAPGDVIDADVIVQLDSTPGFSYGFQLRVDGDAAAHRGMLDRLRDALRRDTRVRLEYVRTGFRNGLLRRVLDAP